MLNEIYRKYFQKSTSLLYPILGFKKHQHPAPLRTYVSWDGIYDVTDRKLMVVYEVKDTPAFKKFEEQMLQKHKLLHEIIQISDDIVIYVFDFNHTHTSDYDTFIQGRYSALSKEAKTNISTYFGMNTPEWIHIESYIFPEKYFKIYAEILDCDEDLLRNVGELCAKYDVEQEQCSYPILVKHKTKI